MIFLRAAAVWYVSTILSWELTRQLILLSSPNSLGLGEHIMFFPDQVVGIFFAVPSIAMFSGFNPILLLSCWIIMRFFPSASIWKRVVVAICVAAASLVFGLIIQALGGEIPTGSWGNGIPFYQFATFIVIPAVASGWFFSKKQVIDNNSQ